MINQYGVILMWHALFPEVVGPHLLSLNKLVEDFYLHVDDTSDFWIANIFLEVPTGEIDLYFLFL